MPSFSHIRRSRLGPALAACAFALALAFSPRVGAEIDPTTGDFSYSGGGGIDSILGQIALYLVTLNRQEGRAYVSREVEEGIGGYQLRFFDNGNKLVDPEDWLSVRRYQIPAVPDSLQPPGYYKHTYVEFADIGLDGIDSRDFYFINGRRFDLIGQPEDLLRQYQIQIESGVSALIRKVGYQALLEKIGALSELDLAGKKPIEEGTLTAKAVLGLDLHYVFSPFQRNGVALDEEEMAREIRQHVGYVYSATVSYTDIQGYRLDDIANQSALLQRSYDPLEARVLDLILAALFDPDGDGTITQKSVVNGYTKFREIHQQLAENARAGNRRIVLPGEKLARLRQDYQATHKKSFEF